MLIAHWEKADAAAAERLTVEVRRVFSKYDQNGDGVLSYAEFGELHKELLKSPAAGGAEDERSNAPELLDLYDEALGYTPAGADGVEAECVSREAGRGRRLPWAAAGGLRSQTC